MMRRKLKKAPIYLDANAGAPLKLAVIEALQNILSQLKDETTSVLGNPSSIHAHGRVGKRMLAEAREKVASSLGTNVDYEQLIFTSCGSEANQLAIHSALTKAFEKQSQDKDAPAPHWITTQIEHDSIRQMIEWFQAQGGVVTELEVHSHGAPKVEMLDGLVRPETALISLLWVNNETGVITPLEPVFAKVKEWNVLLHIDAAQGWGKLPFDLSKWPAHYVTFSSHKIGALAGAGVLWIAPGTPIAAQLPGKQEKGRRGGTESLLPLVALGAAAEVVDPVSWAKRVEPLRDRLEALICEKIKGCRVNGKNAQRVANTMNLSFEGIQGDGLVMALDIAGYSVSSGSACSSGVLEPSHVLLAMGLEEKEAMAALRVSLPDEMPWEELEGFAEALEQVINRARDAAEKAKQRLERRNQGLMYQVQSGAQANQDQNDQVVQRSGR